LSKRPLAIIFDLDQDRVSATSIYNQPGFGQDSTDYSMTSFFGKVSLLLADERITKSGEGMSAIFMAEPPPPTPFFEYFDFDKS
jgi:hypothetical protein